LPKLSECTAVFALVTAWSFLMNHHSSFVLKYEYVVVRMLYYVVVIVIIPDIFSEFDHELCSLGKFEGP
jgi:hypothetical protein